MSPRKDIRIISLNIQHGWNTRHMAPPLRFSEDKVVANLEKIVGLIAEYDADVVLLQEVDRTSPLTRKIDQLSYIQARTGHAYSAYGASSELRRRDKLVYSAGCGIISRYPMTDVENVKFELSFPTPRKGFLSATLSISPTRILTVASVHLVPFNILKARSRHKQMRQLSGALAGKSPLVIGGDLNTSLKNPHMQSLMANLGVAGHRIGHKDKSLHTFPSMRPQRRIDWILASEHLPVHDYRTFPHRVSDHRAIGATFGL